MGKIDPDEGQIQGAGTHELLQEEPSRDARRGQCTARDSDREASKLRFWVYMFEFLKYYLYMLCQKKKKSVELIMMKSGIFQP